MTAVILALLVAIVGGFMTNEVRAWSRWLHHAVRRRAVASLPEKCRARYEEEWENGIEGVPGEILKLIYSVNLLRAAVGIRRAYLSGSLGAEARISRIKRLFDVAFSSAVLALEVPLFFAIAVAIKLDSPGPVFYISERIGKKGVVFRCIKFRTMVRDADKHRTEIMHMDERDDVLFKVANDPRVTRLGRFLRKYSFDELPQFINVLRGDMSIVGPRAPLAGEVGRYDLDHLRRLDVTPGITGLWQVQGRQGPSFASYVSLLRSYIGEWSFWLDFKILLRTIRAAFHKASSNPGRRSGDVGGQDRGE